MTLESIVDGQQPNESFYEGISQEKDYSARIRMVEVLLFSFLLYSGTRECYHPPLWAQNSVLLYCIVQLVLLPLVQ